MGVLGIEDSSNVTGDTQKTLDVLTNDVVVETVKWGGLVQALIPEEIDDEMHFEESATGKYLLATDPLDGSSNIDVNVSVGTIFSILKRAKQG
eukprot:122205_1